MEQIGDLPNYVEMYVEDLNAAEYNPRKISKEEMEKLKLSIQEFGMVQPIIFNTRTKRVVGGHQRLEACRELGIEVVPVQLVDLDEPKEKALNLALNKISGEWVPDMLKDVLEDLDTGDFDMALTGFDDWEIEDLMTQYHVEDDDREAVEDEFDVDKSLESIKEPNTKRGDIYRLGRHVLMCGDSTAFHDVEKLMGGVQADLLLTDPPYNVDYTGKTKEALKIQNDRMNEDSFYQFLLSAHENMYNIAKDGACIYVFHADTEGLNFRSALIDSGFKLSQCLVWVKQTMVMGRQDYHWKHEPILYGWKEGAAHNWYNDRKQTTVLNFDRPTRSEMHPTMKPIDLLSYAIKNNSKPEDVVVDLFAGSGSTMIACEQLNRTSYLMEIDEKYCDVIVERWETYTGEKAVKVHGTEAETYSQAHG